MQILVLAMLWIIWCMLHSLLIDEGGVLMVREVFGSYYYCYRIFYIVFAFISMLPPAYYLYSMKTTVFYEFQGAMQAIPIFLLCYGALMITLGFQAHNLKEFLGVTKGSYNEEGKDLEVVKFSSNGILARIRHPWYAGGLAVIWGAGPLSDGSLTVKIILTGYIILGIQFEERRLLKKFGNEYAEYCKSVPRFIPKLRF